MAILSLLSSETEEWVKKKGDDLSYLVGLYYAWIKKAVVCNFTFSAVIEVFIFTKISFQCFILYTP